MSDIQSHFQQQLTTCPDIKRWVIGLSGGMDSVVLLHLAVQALPTDQLRVLHINHQLQGEADQWQQFCEQLCQELGVAIESHRVAIEPGGSIERAARDARYKVFEASLQAEECLLLAQHRDDQAETLLYRLLRGAGVKGLAAMPRRRSLGKGLILRPLLNCSREQLQDWALSNKYRWVEDPSNQDDRYDRNFLRLHILPKLAERWPGFGGRWAQAAEHLAEADRLLNELAQIDLQQCQVPLNGLNCDQLMALSEARRHNLLRYWIYDSAAVVPGRDWLQRISSEVIGAKVDAVPELVLGKVSLRRFRGQLFLVKDFDSLDWQYRPLQDGNLVLPQGILTVVAGEAEGLKSLENVVIRNRHDGDRCRPSGRGGSRSVKKLFQEQDVPPWLRDSWPICVVGEEIVAVPGICICEGWQSEKKATGFALKWQPFALSETGDSATL
ncbi:MAG: tRNA lysidine(34) synthetase TilS [Amphritea sp.]|nr:tRNA lysidine(34) synthetase TilS [Amphritea sp.]